MQLELIVLDIDGVITDGYERLGLNGPQYKQLSFQDLDAIQEAKQAGYGFALLTAEDNDMVRQISNRLNIEDVHAGYKDKRKGIEAICQERQLVPQAICFLGDSNRDARAFSDVGLSFTPANGSSLARANATFTLHRAGGQGAIAEAIEVILKLRRMAS